MSVPLAQAGEQSLRGWQPVPALELLTTRLEPNTVSTLRAWCDRGVEHRVPRWRGCRRAASLASAPSPPTHGPIAGSVVADGRCVVRDSTPDGPNPDYLETARRCARSRSEEHTSELQS